MKKLFLLIVLLSLIFVGGSVFAQESQLPDPGLTPDSPFYFFKTWKEQIQLFFTFGEANKVKQFLHLSEVRLAEYQKMIEKGKTEIAQKTLEKYQKQLDQALEKAKTQEIGKDAENLMILLKEKALKHQEVLQKVAEQVPDQAEEAINKVLKLSKEHYEKAIEKIEQIVREKLETAAKGEEIKTTESGDIRGVTWKTPTGEERGITIPKIIGMKLMSENRGDCSYQAEYIFTLYKGKDLSGYIKNPLESAFLKQDWELKDERTEDGLQMLDFYTRKAGVLELITINIGFEKEKGTYFSLEYKWPPCAVE